MKSIIIKSSTYLLFIFISSCGSDTTSRHYSSNDTMAITKAAVDSKIIVVPQSIDTSSKPCLNDINFGPEVSIKYKELFKPNADSLICFGNILNCSVSYEQFEDHRACFSSDKLRICYLDELDVDMETTCELIGIEYTKKNDIVYLNFKPKNPDSGENGENFVAIGQNADDFMAFIIENQGDSYKTYDSLCENTTISFSYYRKTAIGDLIVSIDNGKLARIYWYLSEP